MPSSTSPDPPPGGYVERSGPGGPNGNDGIEDAWREPGSDELMTFETLVHVRAESALVDSRRQRKVERRGE